MDGTPWCRMTELNIYTVAYAQVLGPGLCKDDTGYRLAAVALYHLCSAAYSRALLYVCILLQDTEAVITVCHSYCIPT